MENTFGTGKAGGPWATRSPNEIKRLTDMRDHGHMSQREYDQKRLELLARL
jgi:hypothetical protein